MPAWAQSIRFRLSLNYALAVFGAGALLIGGLYIWQVSQLAEPVVITRQLVVRDPATDQIIETSAPFVFPNDIRMAAAEQVELNAYTEALDQLRKASLGALVVLFVVAFGSGWLLAGWALKPVDRITGVAKEISGSDLSRRIALQGPKDELKDLADTFDEMLDRLQASFDQQRRFLHEASHELRNPLAVAATNLEVALSDSESTRDELRDAAVVAKRSTDRMSKLVDDLLAQARSGMPVFDSKPVDLSALVAELVQDFDAGAQARSIEILADPGDGVVVCGDESALRRLLANLVANAVRLAPVSSTVRVSASILELGGVWAIVKVADQGPGIDSELQGRVFERFWKGDDGGSGSGLGLSIVQSIAERHGGFVKLDSTLGVGSTFIVSLPVPISIKN